MIKKEFVQSLAIILKSKNELLKNFIFNWIDELYFEINQQNLDEKLKEFNNFIVENFKDLFLLNKEATNTIIDLHLSNYDPFLFVEALTPFIELQLDFFENIFKAKKMRPFSENFLILHLKLICDHRPEEVNFIINAFNLYDIGLVKFERKRLPFGPIY